MTFEDELERVKLELAIAEDNIEYTNSDERTDWESTNIKQFRLTYYKGMHKALMAYKIALEVLISDKI
jgi:hypothetical protein